MTIFAHEHYSEAWKIFTVNFTSQGNDCNNDAYEMWQYSKACDNDDNLLGMEIQLERRKVNEQCFNGANFERTKTIKACDKCNLKVIKIFKISVLKKYFLGLFLSGRMESYRRQ